MRVGRSLPVAMRAQHCFDDQTRMGDYQQRANARESVRILLVTVKSEAMLRKGRAALLDVPEGNGNGLG